MRHVLVVGGAGFIGSHTCKALAIAGIEPVVYDNLSRGRRSAVKWGPLVVGDILDGDALRAALFTYRPEAVIHFAAFAYVGEFIDDPARYYRNNVVGTITLLNAMRLADVNRLVFSSTCATYGIPDIPSIMESTPQHPINPYGRSKLMCEQAIEDHHRAYGLSFATLRYFNACGLDPAGELGVWHDPETRLIPRALMAAAGRIPQLDIFGDDYPTPDGTCIRDYIHVTDLAEGHVRALARLADAPISLYLNLVMGVGLSVRQVLDGISDQIGHDVPHAIRARRPGDPPVLVADSSLAQRELGFETEYSNIGTIIQTSWPFFRDRP